ncbi:MAG: hypothetical protein JNL87_05095 [Burkholderiaceae bacterium]|nr:hypothetical protein [Burkholderiaceae bacterium]
MIELFPPRRTLGVCLACCLIAVAGCGTVAKAPPTTGVCHIKDGRIDRTIVRETDCDQAAGTWEVRPL